MKQPVVLEVCVDSIESAVAAERGGAHRIELCSGLSEGGVTPSAGLIAAVREMVSIELSVLIRPRPGDFCYSDDEMEVMRRDIATAKQLGADCVVLGILEPDGRIDTARTRGLVHWAAPAKVTFHRAFDMSSNLLRSLDDLQMTGAHRVLTSGGKQTAVDGVETLRHIVRAANGCVRIMAGGGIEENNVAEVVERTGVREIHASLKSFIATPMQYRNEEISLGTLKGQEYQRMVVREDRVRRLLLAACNGESKPGTQRVES